VAAKRNLRTVSADERAKPKKAEPKNISEALAGTSRDVLAAMRKAIAKQLDQGDIAGNAIASAYRELRELDRLIRVADAEREDDAPSDDAGTAFDASAI
jgi:hypothetical protein